MAREDNQPDEIEEDGEYVDIPDEEEAGASASATADAGRGTAAADAGAADADRTAVEEGDEREARREARRLERKQRKERQRQARDANNTEIRQLKDTVAELRGQIDALSRRTQGHDVQTVKQQMAMAKNAYDTANRQLAAALKANNGDIAIQALANRDAAIDHYRQLEVIDRRIAAVPDAKPGVREKPHPDAVRGYNSFRRDNPWFDPELKDEDSRIAFAIDEGLEDEGFDMRTQEYWDELEDRLRERLPHRYEEEGSNGKANGGRANGQERRRGGPPVAGGSQTGGQRMEGRKGVFVARERVDALKELGVWDDPKQRARYIRAYREYDKQHQRTERS